LFEKGFRQIDIRAEEVFEEAGKLPGETRLIGDVLANETDPFFSWQFDENYACPKGCERKDGGLCGVVDEDGKSEL
jgi:hypothetical protein